MIELGKPVINSVWQIPNHSVWNLCTNELGYLAYNSAWMSIMYQLGESTSAQIVNSIRRKIFDGG